jgi:hypothetical protein
MGKPKMPAITIPAVLIAAVGGWFGIDAAVSPPKPPSKPAAAKPGTTAPSDLVAADFTANFAPGRTKLKDVFVPGLSSDLAMAHLRAPDREPTQIPKSIALGDPNWIYVGYIQVSGVRSAILKNRLTNISEMANEGAVWKKGRIVLVSSSQLVIQDDSGAKSVVNRFYGDSSPEGTIDPAAPSKPESEITPVDARELLKGPIGELTIEPTPNAKASKT